jgi:subtilisin family serine protease
MIGFRFTAALACAGMLVATAGCNVNNGAGPGVPLAGGSEANTIAGSPGSQNPLNRAPAGMTTVSAQTGDGIRVTALVDNVARRLPYAFRPAFSIAPHSVYFNANDNGSVTGYTYNFQTGPLPRTIYFNVLRDLQGTIGPIAPAAAFAKRPAEAQIALVPLPHASRPGIVANELYVTYDASVLARAATSAPALEARSGVVARAGDLLSANPGRMLRRVEIDPSVPRERAIAALRGLPGVVAVDPVHYSYLFADDAKEIHPNDPGYLKNDQWYLEAIQAPQAWGITTGNPAVTVGIIDTGIDAHNLDFAGKLVSGESVLGGVVTKGLAASQDQNGHGTHVAGTTAATTNNGVGFAGVGYNVKLRAYKVFPLNGGASDADIATAIRDALADGARVVNMSLGSDASEGVDVGTWNAVKASTAAGMTIVAAAGNEAQPTVGAPANLPEVISVGASALNDRAQPNFEYVSAFSNYGPDLTLVAPGGDMSGWPSTPNHGIDNLYTTTAGTSPPCKQNPNAVTGCGYSILQGTSMASPVVAGVAALMISKNPKLTPAQIKRTLAETADDINDPRQSAGRVNAYRAVAAVAGIKAPVAPDAHNFLAIAYTVKPGSNVPQIIDRTFLGGARVGVNGVFRLPDIGPKPVKYSVGLWYDANGNGIVDSGDWFGSVQCTQEDTDGAECHTGGIPVTRVPAKFVLK